MLVIKTLTLSLMLLQSSQLEQVDSKLYEHSKQLVEQRLKLWSHRQQDSQLTEVIAQMMRVAPEHPRLVEIAIYAALAEGRRDDAERLWQLLRERAPQHLATRRVAERMTLSNEQQQSLSQVELYLFAGRYEEAASILRTLYDEPPLTLTTAILYWDVIGRVESRERAIGGLQQLQRLYPDAPELTLSIASHKLAIDALKPSDLAQLTQLSLNPVFGEQALGIWLRALSELPATPDFIRQVNTLAGYFPRHSDIARYRKILYAQRDANARSNSSQTAQTETTSQAPEAAPLPDPWAAYDRAVAALEQNNATAAERIMQQLLMQNQSSDARFAKALLLEKIDRDDEALALAREVLATDKGEGVTALFERLVARQRAAEIAAQQAADEANQVATDASASDTSTVAVGTSDRDESQETFLWLGYTLSERESTPGISSLDSNTLMLRLSSTFGDEQQNRWFLQLDPTTVSAGAADLDDSYWRPRFGTGLLCDDSCPTGIWPEAEDQGIAIGFGVEWQNWHADIGRSPIGFRQSEWVGSVGYDGDLGEFGWGIEAERRVLTSALVNFAGAEDPYSGREWGPVMESTLGGSFNWDQGTGWGWWSNFGVSHYGGKELKSNRRWYAYTGVYKTFYDTEAFAFDSGLTALTWGYANDQSQTTFGQGGYYSPKSYASLSIPLSVYGRVGRLSYLVRASLGQSTTKLSASEFFPAHPELQQQALALSGETGINPVFAGGTGGGFGTSLRATLEYRLSNHWYIGGSTNIQRSEFYDPNHFSLYLRYDFAGQRRSPNRPPYPPQEYVSEPWWE
ncbi:Cellulose synthase operon protein C [Pseudidiomarina piscicola]|uniref:Cellulose synthase operon protein C n=1 Tax=Pseudidiomarina piscicola TaxID=2614830 RepID=A0A6S6WN53_9GAMM|nr:cellulose synthase subunit BcsC-related outer membrane protein [Pseudidiomarina piscicola]CAB0150153.1 Cellulose synthase operon protein C [Pseudidiomarina piscicola]VZT39592.1 Cellulose synthase operon protein C [Pseudomonas aeruginosa]